VLGVIVALGDRWMYREYYRTDLPNSPTPSERRDPTFVGSNSGSVSPDTMPARVCVSVEEAFGISGFGCLQSTRSNNALRIVRLRMRTIASEMFPNV
jgi:hypothetical protein